MIFAENTIGGKDVKISKKVIYASLAVMLVLAALIAFVGNQSKDYSVDDLSTDDTIVELEETPIPEVVDAVTETDTAVQKENESSSKQQEKSKPSGSEPAKSDTPAKYEDFMNMSSKDQQKFVDSFANMDAFFDWYNAAKKVYEQENPPIEVGDGVINIGEIIEEKN